MDKNAVISDCGKYRYYLSRCWDFSKPNLMFVMLNPSRVDANIDDKTILKCIKYGKRFDCGSIGVVNLYAYRSTDPKTLKDISASEAKGPENSKYLRRALSSNSLVICGWGTPGAKGTPEFTEIAKESPSQLWCFKVNKNGSPKHPLYCRDDQILLPYNI